MSRSTSSTLFVLAVESWNDVKTRPMNKTYVLGPNADSFHQFSSSTLKAISQSKR